MSTLKKSSRQMRSKFFWDCSHLPKKLAAMFPHMVCLCNVPPAQATTHNLGYPPLLFWGSIQLQCICVKTNNEFSLTAEQHSCGGPKTTGICNAERSQPLTFSMFALIADVTLPRVPLTLAHFSRSATFLILQYRPFTVNLYTNFQRLN